MVPGGCREETAVQSQEELAPFAVLTGVLPLAIAKGPGAEMRQALGTAVFSGMLEVTSLHLLLTRVFSVILRRFAKERASWR